MLFGCVSCLKIYKQPFLQYDWLRNLSINPKSVIGAFSQVKKVKLRAKPEGAHNLVELEESK